jgi:hypothetical protein
MDTAADSQGPVGREANTMRTSIVCWNNNCTHCQDPKCGHHCHYTSGQLGIFDVDKGEPDLPPVARVTDEPTSHAATPAPTSRTTIMRNLLAQFVRNEFTSEQATQGAGYQPADGAWKRVSDLRNAGYIQSTGRTRKASSGREQTVWQITEAGRAWMGGAS